MIDIAECYINELSPNKPTIARYWVTKQMLIGGNILNMDDLNHLVNDFGIKSIINVDAMQNHTGAIENLLQVSVLDNGDGFSEEIVHKVIKFAETHISDPIYIHCHMGYSRSPHFAYAILRSLGLSQRTAYNKIKLSLPSHNHVWGFSQHTTSYIDSIEKALISYKG
jgi:protein-tyrosine phosphatase